MSEILKRNTPEEDYAKICKSAIKKYKYPSGANVSYVKKEDILKKNKAYRIILKTVQVAAICLGISAVLAAVFGLLAFAADVAVNITKPLFTGSLIIFLICLAIIMILGIAGGIIEASAESEDSYKEQILSAETAILNDGKIIFYGRTNAKGCQQRERGLTCGEETKNMEITFCFTIEKVKSLTQSPSGVLTCIASGTKRYIVFPYSPDNSSDAYNYYFYYKQKYVSSATLQWFNNLDGFSDLQCVLKNIMKK